MPCYGWAGFFRTQTWTPWDWGADGAYPYYPGAYPYYPGAYPYHPGAYHCYPTNMPNLASPFA